MTGALYIGTSGFAYPEWKPAFYPEDVKQADMLTYYAGRFSSVEINYTFRRFPSAKTLTRWAEQGPDGFRFALKANQRITHTRRLRDADTDVSDFLQLARLLGDNLGPILFQCPPTLQFDRGLIESFLAYLPPIAPYAMEFRHESWVAARDLLAENGVAWCTAETDSALVDRSSIPSEPFTYLRLRKESYTTEDIAAWATGIRKVLDSGRDVYAYFKHEDGAAAPRWSQELARVVDAQASDPNV